MKTVDAWTDYNQTDDIEDLGNGLLRVTSFCPEDENNPSNDLYANQIERIINISQYQQVITADLLNKLILTFSWRGSGDSQTFEFPVSNWQISQNNPTILAQSKIVYFDPVDRIFKGAGFQDVTYNHEVWICGNCDYAYGLYPSFGTGSSANRMTTRIYLSEKNYNGTETTTILPLTDPLPSNWVIDYPTTTP